MERVEVSLVSTWKINSFLCHFYLLLLVWKLFGKLYKGCFPLILEDNYIDIER